MMGKRVLVVLLLVARVVEGYPAEDLVERLPGQPKVPFRQYAGHVTVDKKAGSSLFYYFVEAYTDVPNRPLTLWLNGGPGCSSVGGGAFTEFGPFFPAGVGRRLRLNKNSWNRVSNLLFVESPAGVGWSYSNTDSDYTTGDDRTANDMREFLIRWFEKFPEYQSRDLFLTGESYAGHYVPQLAIALLNYNKQSTGFKFRIKGIALGNPLLNVEKDMPSVYKYLWSHGVISDETGFNIMKECGFNYFDFDFSSNATQSCKDAIDKSSEFDGNYIDKYDLVLDVCSPTLIRQELQLQKSVTKMSVGADVCMIEEMEFYLNLPQVQHALHANRTNPPQNWTVCTNLNYSLSDPYMNMVPLLKEIIGYHIPIWVYSGDQDSVIPLLGTRRIIRELAQDLKFQVTDPYRAWFHDQQVGGWTIEYGNILTFATVRGASHMVPFSQPTRALALFQAFANEKRLPNTTYPRIDC